MPSINVSEADFQAVAGAALAAKSSGDMAEARALDKLARKINLALSATNSAVRVGRMFGVYSEPRTWRDMPSVLAIAETAD